MPKINKELYIQGLQDKYTVLQQIQYMNEFFLKMIDISNQIDDNFKVGVIDIELENLNDEQTISLTDTQLLELEKQICIVKITTGDLVFDVYRRSKDLDYGGNGEYDFFENIHMVIMNDYTLYQCITANVSKVNKMLTFRNQIVNINN